MFQNQKKPFLTLHTDPYQSFDYEEKTTIGYVQGAFICERTLRLYGKEGLFKIFKSKEDIWQVLNTVGLTKENLTVELTKELQLPYFSFVEGK